MAEEQVQMQPPFTIRRTCPFTISVSKSSIVGSAPDETRALKCIGPDCQLWQFQPGTDPRTGECSHVITAQAASATAQATMQVAQSIAQILASAGVKTEPPGDPTEE